MNMYKRTILLNSLLLKITLSIFIYHSYSIIGKRS